MAMALSPLEAAVMSAEEEAGFLTAGVFDATSTFHKTAAAPAAPPRPAAPPGDSEMARNPTPYLLRKLFSLFINFKNELEP
jgi:hypothetical protein